MAVLNLLNTFYDPETPFLHRAYSVSDQKKQSLKEKTPLSKVSVGLPSEIFYIERILDISSQKNQPLKEKTPLSEVSAYSSFEIPSIDRMFSHSNQEHTYPVKRNAVYKTFYPKIKALREDEEQEPAIIRMESELRTVIVLILKIYLKMIFYGTYEQRQEAYSYIISTYSPEDVLKEIVNYENEDDYDERLCYASKILRRMKEEDAFEALENFFNEHIRENQEKYWIIKNFISTICGFEFSDNSLNKRRIDFLKLIHKSYSPESEKGYKKEKMQEVFKKEIQSSLEDANTPFEDIVLNLRDF